MNKLNQEEINSLKDFCTMMREDILKTISGSKSGHPGGSLSCVEILTVLYKKIMKTCPEWHNDSDFENRDRFVLSKGHASAALYAILANCGYFDKNLLPTFRKINSHLQGHPSFGHLPGIEVSTGSLGQGLSMACGMALGLKLDKKSSRVYALLGDGEMQEGQIWEALMHAAHRGLDNLCVIVDRNRLQIDGDVDSVKSLGNLSKKLSGFGFEVMEIDGHNLEQIYDALTKSKEINKTTGRPTAIIANTIKGRGVSFMENNASWHGNPPSEEQLAVALQELRGAK